MKEIVKALIVLFLITITLFGCGVSDESNAKKIAEQFGKNLYTVDEKQIPVYKDAFSQKGDATKLLLLHKDLQPLMTEKEFKSLIADRSYIINLEGCVRNDCTMQITDLILTKRFYDSKENKVGYDYEAKVKLISNEDKKEQVDESKGYIGLSKESGQWKVYSYKLITIPKLFMLILK